MDMIREVGGVKYAFIPLKDLNQIKDIAVLIRNAEKNKKCLKKCSVIQRLKIMAGEL